MFAYVHNRYLIVKVSHMLKQTESAILDFKSCSFPFTLKLHIVGHCYSVPGSEESASLYPNFTISELHYFQFHIEIKLGLLAGVNN